MLYRYFFEASWVPGSVTVMLQSEDGTYLGRTVVSYYEDPVERVLQQIVVDPGLQKRLFDKFNTINSLGGSQMASGGDDSAGGVGKLPVS